MSRQVSLNTSYTDRLVKLLPIEFVTAYVAITQASQSSDILQPILLCTTTFFIILIPIYLIFIQHINSIFQIIITTLSFVVWSYSLGDAFRFGPWITTNLYDETIASVLLILWTSIVPILLPMKSSQTNGVHNVSN